MSTSIQEIFIVPVNNKSTKRKTPVPESRRAYWERNKAIIRLSKTVAQVDIAAMYGITRQRVHFIIHQVRP